MKVAEKFVVCLQKLVSAKGTSEKKAKAVYSALMAYGSTHDLSKLITWFNADGEIKSKNPKQMHVYLYGVSDGSHPTERGGWYNGEMFVSDEDQRRTVNFADPDIQEGIHAVLDGEGLSEIRIIKAPRKKE